MEFELEYKLKLFREEQPDLFDENNERYTATPIGKDTAEIMLQLINEFESALANAETKIEQLTIPYVIVPKGTLCDTEPIVKAPKNMGYGKGGEMVYI